MSSIGAIILAGGMSTRMQQPKLLLPIQGKPMIQHVIDRALHPAIDRIVIVLGAHASAIRQHIDELSDLTFIYNERYKQGIGTSLACGMKAMCGHVDATFVLLADQPFVSSVVMNSLIEHYKKAKKRGKWIVRPSYNRKEGHPILFNDALFSSFFHLQDDIGGKEIVRRHEDALDIIEFSNEFWGRDIDTPQDYYEMKSIEE